jgi:hypothetical protein
LREVSGLHVETNNFQKYKKFFQLPKDDQLIAEICSSVGKTKVIFCCADEKVLLRKTSS